MRVKELKANVSSSVSIASINVRLSKMARKERELILLGKTGQEKLTRDAPHIFQSCTFNRSLTSPVKSFLLGACFETNIARVNYLQNQTVPDNYLDDVRTLRVCKRPVLKVLTVLR